MYSNYGIASKSMECKLTYSDKVRKTNYPPKLTGLIIRSHYIALHNTINLKLLYNLVDFC